MTVRVRAVAVIVLASGCNQVLGLDPVSQTIVDANLMDADLRADLDADGLPDVNDPCIAGPIDELVDLDFDDIPSGVDACAFDASEDDRDQDGVAGACDAFPAHAGDRRRCVMSFRDIDLNPLLWRPRPGGDGWNLAGMATVGSGTGTIVAVTPLEAPGVTTYVVHGFFASNQLGEMPSLRVIVRGSPDAGDRDTGCELNALGGRFELALVPRGNESTTLSGAGYFTLRATFTTTPGAETALRCDLVLPDGQAMSLAEKVALAPGRFAFAASTALVTLVGLGVYERADVPL